MERRPTKPDLKSLVFPAPKGGPIDDHNFSQRIWRKILDRLEIDYREPYNMRHTFISHSLEAGANPVLLAQLTGHNVKTLYEHYAGYINSSPRLPDVLSRP